MIICILENLELLKGHNLNVVFCWVPGHDGIVGNKEEDSIAKKALNAELDNCPIPVSDLKPVLTSYIQNMAHGIG